MPEPINEVQPAVVEKPPFELHGDIEHTAQVETNPFNSIRQTMDGLVNQIREGRNIDESKEALSSLLKAREAYYRDIAMAINPDIQPVEGHNYLYRVGDSDIYGSITAVIDATPAIAHHKDIAKKLRTKVGNAKNIQGEDVQPKQLMDSLIVFAGSTAQDRIQPFAADMDLAEYIKITAESTKEASELLSRGISESTNDVQVIQNQAGDHIIVHFNGMRTGIFPHDAADLKAAGEWNIQEIKRGYKTYVSRSGETKQFSLQDACNRPPYIKSNYICLTEDSVFGMSKMTDIMVNNKEGKQVYHSVPPEAKAMQQVFFDDPSEYHLIDRAYDANGYVKYLDLMENEVRRNPDPHKESYMKIMKRLYNVYKASGDLSGARELGEFFSSPAAAIYQLETRYKFGREAVAKGFMTSPQRQKIKEQLLEVLALQQNPLARQAEEMLSNPHIHQIYDQFHDTIRRLVNAEATIFLTDHPDLQKKITALRTEKKIS
jgi:hypothetical protein